MSCDDVHVQVIREIMPPVFAIESSMQTRNTANFPAPLNLRPLPPLIIVEKGESLDEFAARKDPDFFTAIQVHCCYLWGADGCVLKRCPCLHVACCCTVLLSCRACGLRKGHQSQDHCD